MKKLVALVLLSGLCSLGAQDSGQPPKPPRPEGWVETFYTPSKPCRIIRYDFFCCPIKKSIQVKKARNVRINYYYNARNEIIGWRKITVGKDDNNQSTIVALGCNCTQCQRQKTLVHYWKNQWRTKILPARKK